MGGRVLAGLATMLTLAPAAVGAASTADAQHVVTWQVRAGGKLEWRTPQRYSEKDTMAVHVYVNGREVREPGDTQGRCTIYFYRLGTVVKVGNVQMCDVPGPQHVAVKVTTMRNVRVSFRWAKLP